jgi:hypothetical protein
LTPQLFVRRADVFEIDICSGRKTVEIVSSASLSLFTATGRGVNEKATIRRRLKRYTHTGSQPAQWVNEKATIRGRLKSPVRDEMFIETRCRKILSSPVGATEFTYRSQVSLKFNNLSSL